jgi:hypothetical protein
LPPNERRRASHQVRLAFGACEQAVAGREEEARGLGAVFASSGGDYAINDQLCRTLAGAERRISPTQFHNSVHNAPSGYWGIATGSRAPSLSLCAYDDTAGAALLEAVTQVVLDSRPLLLAVYDDAVAWPMVERRPVARPFSAAFWLSPKAGAHSLARLAVTPAADGENPTTAPTAALEALRRENPAARCLPLLASLAAGGGRVVMGLPRGRRLGLEVAPC